MEDKWILKKIGLQQRKDRPKPFSTVIDIYTDAQ